MTILVWDVTLVLIAVAALPVRAQDKPPERHSDFLLDNLLRDKAQEQQKTSCGPGRSRSTSRSDPKAPAAKPPSGPIVKPAEVTTIAG